MLTSQKNAKFSPKSKKDLGTDSQKSKQTRGNAITHPQSHSIHKIYIL